ncbi:antibiotic biosynthesis monooxygenase [Kitasatospora sp. NBC_00240]|uniref:putative quinol monooxygenase n=1 Tax=Kitasatospora sp. NBC_00240 TaxID=2903567 RepID=UPI00224E4989|nr:putative quinol monooxygenase [Kitasatospora sp. NBC_00240]MCX5208737.1 antibiotic biosynthesis monooxygenase [Kitasatospora sp. NBC_00240]
MIVIATLVAAAGRSDRLRTALEAMIEPSLEEPGCLAYQLYADPNRPEQMAIVEEWTDEAALQFHFGTDHFRQVAETLAEVLAEPLQLRRLTDIAS